VGADDNEGTESLKTRTTGVTLVVGLAACGLLAGCSSISTTYDFDTRLDFNQLRTFDWMQEQPVTIPDPRREEAVRDQFVAALEARGFEKVEHDADFRLVMYAGAEGNIQVSAFGYGYGPRSTFWGPTAGFIETYAYRDGTLVLDVVNAETSELAWRGTAQGVLDASMNPEDRRKLVTEAIDKMLRNFPPPPQS